MITWNNEEEKKQVAINMMNLYNLKEANKNGIQDKWVNLTELPDGLTPDMAICKYYPVYPEGHIANCGSIYGKNINIE